MDLFDYKDCIKMIYEYNETERDNGIKFFNCIANDIFQNPNKAISHYKQTLLKKFNNHQEFVKLLLFSGFKHSNHSTSKLIFDKTKLELLQRSHQALNDKMAQMDDDDEDNEDTHHSQRRERTRNNVRYRPQISWNEEEKEEEPSDPNLCHQYVQNDSDSDHVNDEESDVNFDEIAQDLLTDKNKKPAINELMKQIKNADNKPTVDSTPILNKNADIFIPKNTLITIDEQNIIPKVSLQCIPMPSSTNNIPHSVDRSNNPKMATHQIKDIEGDNNDQAFEEILGDGVEYLYKRKKQQTDLNLNVHDFIKWKKKHKIKRSDFSKTEGNKLKFVKKLKKDLSLKIRHGQILWDYLCDKIYIDSLKQKIKKLQNENGNLQQKINEISCVNNWYYVQCLNPNRYQSPIIPHPMHQQQYFGVATINSFQPSNPQNITQQQITDNVVSVSVDKNSVGGQINNDGISINQQSNNTNTTDSADSIKHHDNDNIGLDVTAPPYFPSNKNVDKLPIIPKQMTQKGKKRKRSDGQQIAIQYVSSPLRISSLSDKQLVVLRGLPGSGKTVLAKKLVKTNANSVICGDDQYYWSGKQYDAGKYEFRPHLAFKAREFCRKQFVKLVEAPNIKLIVLEHHHAKISMYEPFIKYAINNGFNGFRIIEIIGDQLLIDTYKCRSTKTIPRNVFVKLLNVWQQDPRAELIYGHENDKNVIKGIKNNIV